MSADRNDRDQPEVAIHLVRHGQSTWNVERRLQGQTPHPPLTDQGRVDAQRAAETLAALVGVGADEVAIYSSDLLRAMQTADIIGRRLRCTVNRSHALREQHLGSLQGRLTRDLVPEPVPAGIDISEVRWGGGESLEDVYHRLRGFFATEIGQIGCRASGSAPASHIVLVTHGDTLRVARALLSGRTHREVEWEVVANGAVISLPYDRSHLR